MNSWFLNLARLSLLAIFTEAALALWGWLSNHMLFAQIRPQYITMQYNTAICMLLCAMGTYAMLRQERRASYMACLLVALIAGITLLQYISGMDLHINTLLIPSFATAPLPKATGLNTALALLLTSTAILICSKTYLRARHGMLVVLISSLIFALGAVPLLGYVSGIQEAYQLGTFTRMSLPSSCCFILFATILTFYAGQRSRTLHQWMPVPVFLTLATVSFAASLTVDLHEQQGIRQLLQQRVNEQAPNYTGHLQDLYNALNRVGLRWEAANGTPRTLWEEDTASYRSDIPFLSGISWLDRDGRLQWISPLKGNEGLIGKQLTQDAERAATILKAKETDSPRVTPPITLYNHTGLGYLYMRPVHVHGQYDGMMISVIHMPSMLATLSQHSMDNDFYYALEYGGKIILTNLPTSEPKLLDWQVSAPFDNLNENYRLILYPRPAFLLSHHTLVSTAVLGMGLLMSVLVALSTFLMLRERWQARLLRTSEETFRMAMGHSPIGMALVSPQGGWLEVNQALCDIVGYRREELLVTDFQTITHQDDLEADLELVQKVISGELKSYALEKRYFHKRGHEIKILLNVSLVRHDDDSPHYFISMIQDISERQKLLSQLQQTNANLEQFAYVASHDLQEPLRMVTSFVGLIGSLYADKLDVQGKEFITIAVDAAKRMQALINDLLEYARLGYDSKVLTPIDCPTEMRHVLMNLDTLIKGTGAVVHVQPLPAIRGNPVEFLRLMQNLIGNGIKFQRPGVKPEIHVSAKQDGDHWVFAVRDNGIGIKPEYYERIFQPFKRLHTQQEYHGSGIGLAVCRKIVENLGGTIWIESVMSEGSSIFFTAPIITGEDA